MTSSITIPVDAATASIFATASPEVRGDIERIVTERLQREKSDRVEFLKAMDEVVQNASRRAKERPADPEAERRSRAEAHDRLLQSMDRLAAEAKENGLTPEILEKILRDG